MTDKPEQLGATPTFVVTDEMLHHHEPDLLDVDREARLAALMEDTSPWNVADPLGHRFEVTRRVRLYGLSHGEAREQVNAELLAAWTAAVAPVHEALVQIVEALRPAFERAARSLAELARQHPELLGPPAKPEDPIARARHGRGTGPALPGMDGRRRR
jgi:hypothetical protein